MISRTASDNFRRWYPDGFLRFPKHSWPIPTHCTYDVACNGGNAGNGCHIALGSIEIVIDNHSKVKV
jgi:hypothetical protein